MKAFISEAYGMSVYDLSPLPRGFYGETYRAETDAGIFAVKLDRWPTHKREFEASLDKVDMIGACGIDFVPSLIRGRNGEKCFEYDGGVLAMFEYAVGEHTGDFPPETLFEYLGRIYARCKAPQLSADQLFNMETYERVCRLKALLEPCDAAGKAIIDLLDSRRATLDDRAAKLRVFMGRCRSKSFRTVLTHGDPGGNCIINGDRMKMIDWDTAKYSVPERDAWAYMRSRDSIERIEAGMAKGGFDYRLDTDAFGFFSNAWFFDYIGNYLQCAVDSNDMRQEMGGYLEEYFDCWISDVLKIADDLL